MTSNVSGLMTVKCFLAAAYDPDRPDQNSTFSTSVGTLGAVDWSSYSAGDAAAATHWQDTVSDHIMDKSMGGTAAGNSNTTLDRRPGTELTPANEFELDVERLTHTWQTLTAVGPLPAIPKLELDADENATAQLNALAIDLGMMREKITVQGVLYDRVNHPSSSSGHHIRRQHLLDIARTQYGYIHNMNRDSTSSWLDLNRFPALTIGPASGRAASGNNRDDGYIGEEPSDDVRGREVKGPQSSVGHDSDAASSWDWSFYYEGRRRYRGIIRRLNLSNEGGRPDIWRYTFEFWVVKNEMQMRMLT